MNKDLIIEAIILPFFWLFAYAFTSAVGSAFIPFQNQKGVLLTNLFTRFWYGLGISIAFLQIWNLFMPVNIFSWICLLPIAVFGAINLLRSFPLVSISRPNYIICILGISVLFFLIFSSLDNTFIYDTLVYHFYSIKWLNTYPVIPGMGNLFIYLGLNQSYFLYASFLNGLWGNYKGACSTNGLLAVVICAEIILSNVKYLREKEKLTFSSIFQLLFLPLCINVGVQNLSSPTPDVFVNLLTFKILSDLIHCLEAKRISFQDLFLLALYCLLGVTMKLSFAGIALGILIVVTLIASSEKLWKFNLILKSIVFFGVLIIPWMVRGIISTGYIGFPISLFSIPVDWAVPKSIVENFSAYVKGFARSHLHGKEGIAAAYNYNWLLTWCKRMIYTIGFVVPVLLFLGISSILRIKRIKITKFDLILIPIFTSIIFWFFTAPDIRFAVFTFWALGFTPLVYYIFHVEKKWMNVFMIFISICSLLVIIRNWNTDPEPLGDLPQKNSSIFITKSGLRINTIKNTPPSDDWRIDDCTMPCSVFPDSGLMLRGRNIKEGFKISSKASKN